MNGKKTKLPVPRARRFRNNDAARTHIESVRWDGTVACPSCSTRIRRQGGNARGRYFCEKCRWFSCRTGTAFERSRVPLTKWLLAIREMATSPEAVSPSHLFRYLELRSYHTAQKMCATLSEAARVPDDLVSLLIQRECEAMDRARHAALANRKAKVSRTAKPRSRSGVPPTDGIGRRIKKNAGINDRYSLSEAAARLGWREEDLIALSRAPGAYKVIDCIDDKMVVRDANIQPLQNLFVSKADLLADPEVGNTVDRWRSRPVKQDPLPPRPWQLLKAAFERYERSRSKRKSVYVYLNEVTTTMTRCYRRAGARHSRRRLSRQGLQAALIESSTLSADRCNRYARAIRLVLQSPRYDRTLESFESILLAHGGLDRAVRGGTRQSPLRVAVVSTSATRRWP